MVTIPFHNLLVAGLTASPTLATRFTVPTAMGGLTVSYTADSCIANPEPAAASATVFYPDAFADYMPALGDPIHHEIELGDMEGHSGDFAYPFGGLVESVTETPTAGVPDADLALVPATRNLDGAAPGWSVDWTPVTPDTAPALLTGHGSTITASLPDDPDGQEVDNTVVFTSPEFTLPPGTAYFVTFAATCDPWYAENSSLDPAVANAGLTQHCFPPGLPGYPDGTWYSLRCCVTPGIFRAPAGPDRLVFTLSTNGSSFARALSIAGISIHVVPADRDPWTWWHDPNRARPAGTMVEIGAQDVSAMAGRMRVGFPPMPSTPCSEAIDAISTVSAPLYFDSNDILNGSYQAFTQPVGPIDADNRSPLELYQLYLAAEGRNVIAEQRVDTAALHNGQKGKMIPARIPKYGQILTATGAGLDLVDSLAQRPDSWTLADGALLIDWASAADGKGLQFRDAAGHRPAAYGPYRPTAPGDNWTASIFCGQYRSSDWNVLLRIYWYTSNKAYISSSFLDSTKTAAGDNRTLSGSATAPAGAAYARMGIYAADGTTTVGWHSLRDPTGHITNPVVTADPDPYLPTVLARNIVDAPRASTVDDVANTVTVGYRSPPSGTSLDYEDRDYSITDAASAATYGAASVKIETLMTVIDGQAPAGPAVERGRMVLAAQSKPFYKLDGGASVVVDLVGYSENAWRLFDVRESFGSLVRILGAPEKLGEYQRVRGFSAEFGATVSLVLDIEPAYYSGALAVTAAQLLSLSPGDPLREATFARSTLTANDLRTISAPDPT